MSDKTTVGGTEGYQTGHWFVSTDMMNRILTEQGGTGTTPEDAERFLEQVGASDAILALMWIRIAEFRARIGIVLTNLERYVAENPRESTIYMARECQTILQEFVELCEAAGLIESRCILAVVDEDM